jgi:Domain of unknown function (DUF2382)
VRIAPKSHDDPDILLAGSGSSRWFAAPVDGYARRLDIDLEEGAVQGVDIDTALDWRGRVVVDRHGEKIGTLKEIYLDESERPSWGSIHTALFGLRETLAPLIEAQPDGEQLRLPYEREHVKAAPNVDPDVQLTSDEEQCLYQHYGLAAAESEVQAGRAGALAAGKESDARAVAAAGPDRGVREGSTAASSSSRSESDRAVAQGGDDAMTRSEEEVRIGKRTRERGRARLKKYVVTDYVETKVPVKREEVRLEREPPDEPARD